MKTRYFLTWIAFLAMSLSVALAQDVKEKSPSQLNGVWQMCFYRSSSPDVPGELKTGNSLKILSDDGRFVNLVMMNQGAIMIGYGSYHINSEKSYTEVVKKNIHLPQLEGQENELFYEFSDDHSIMYVKFFVKFDTNGNQVDSWVHEIWKRVEMPAQMPDNLVR
ncbi:MAG: DUF4488 domain-containing protein [Phocaeicola plebeius]